MSWGTVRRQDAAAHMPLAVCRDGAVVALVPEDADATSAEGIAQLRDAVAAQLSASVEDFEILTVCHRHPDSSAVDCLECEPV